MFVTSLHFNQTMKIHGIGAVRDIALGDPARDGQDGAKIKSIEVDELLTIAKIITAFSDGKVNLVKNRNGTAPVGSEIRVRLPDGTSCVIPSMEN